MKFQNILEKPLENKYLLSIVAGFIITLCAIPALLGGDIPINIRDGFESNWGILYILDATHSWTYSAYEKVAGIGNGFERIVFPSEFFLTSWLHMTLSPLGAFLTTYLLIILTAFVSITLLLQSVVPKLDRGVCYLISATFAAIPFWTPAALTIPALPLFIWGFLKLFQDNQQRKFLFFLPAILLPVCGHFFTLYIFVIPALGFYWLTTSYKNKSFYVLPALYLSTATALFILVDYRLFEAFLFGGQSDYVSNRADRDIVLHNFHVISKKFFHFLADWNDPVEAPLCQKFLMPLILAMPAIMIWQKKFSRAYFLLLGTFVLMGAILALWRWEMMSPLMDLYFIKIVNWSRFHWAAPVVIYVLVAVCAKIIWDTKNPVLKWIFVVTLIVQAGYNLSFRAIAHIGDAATPTFFQFYAEPQYPDILKKISEDTSNPAILHIGLPSTISMYHHLPVLDFYATNYPLAYKRAFREIIAGELAKSPRLTDIYDRWGDRVYMFFNDMESQSIHYFAPRTLSDGYILEQNSFNWSAAKEISATHVISAVKLEDKRLKYIGKYGTELSYWTLYLYKL